MSVCNTELCACTNFFEILHHRFRSSAIAIPLPLFVRSTKDLACAQQPLKSGSANSHSKRQYNTLKPTQIQIRIAPATIHQPPASSGNRCLGLGLLSLFDLSPSCEALTRAFATYADIGNDAPQLERISKMLPPPCRLRCVGDIRLYELQDANILHSRPVWKCVRVLVYASPCSCSRSQADILKLASRP